MNEKKILILGGSGFIGRAMCKKFLENGYEVEVFCRGMKFHNLFKGIRYTYGDFLNYDCLYKILKRHKNVLHLISTINPSTSLTDPLKGYQNDLIQTFKIIEILKNNGGRIFFASSGGTVYGIQEKFPIDELAPTKPINHYGIIKLSIEKILTMYNTLYSMNNVIFRISNPYGPGQDYRIGGIGVIDAFLRNAINREQIKIYGDGSIARDFIFIDTLCEYLFKVIDKNKCESEIYNIGSGECYTLNEIIKIIQKEFGFVLNIKYIDKRDIDVPKIELDITRFMKEFKIIQKFNIRDGINKTLQSYGFKQNAVVDFY